MTTQPPASHCPLCGGECRAAFATRDRNWGVSSRTFTYARCGSCRTYHLEDVPDDLERYYPPGYYNLMPVAELDRAADRERSKVDLLLRFGRASRLLEIGAGYGVFARAALRAGYDVTAIEMDERCCDYLRSVAGVRALQSDAPEEAVRDLGRYEAIVLWHVLEHVPDPALLIKRLAANLQPGGLLALATPNPSALQFRALRARWAHVDAPRHLFLIPSRALIEHAGAVGLEVVHLTTADPAGRTWNRFGWDYAFRRRPAARSPSLVAHGMSLLLTTALRGIEGRRLNGTTYTIVFRARAATAIPSGPPA